VSASAMSQRQARVTPPAPPRSRPSR
jgi:hypothetical protein